MESEYFGWIQFRCRIRPAHVRVPASSDCLPSDSLVTDSDTEVPDIAKNTVPIQVAPFQSVAMHLPLSLGLQLSRLYRFDLMIQVVSHWF